MTVNTQFWQGQKVIITGAAGFVGSHLTRKLLGLGALVTAVVSKKGGYNKVLLPAHSNLKVAACNLTNFKATDSLFKKSGARGVFHLAASPIVSRAARQPHSAIRNNVLASLNVLEASRRNKIKRLLLASSDKAYGDHAADELEGLPYAENYSLRGIDIYSASKASADSLAQAYAFQYKISIAVVRCCNIYGPGDINFTRLIPLVSMLLLSGKPPVIKAGHERVLREYLYIDDAVDAYVFLAEKIEGYYGKNAKNMPFKGKATYGWTAFNVGSYTKRQTKNLKACENIKNVTEVISALRKAIRDIKPKVVKKPRQFIEIPDEYMDSTKITKMGFRSKVGFGQGVSRAAAWYKTNFKVLKRILDKMQG